MENKGIDKTAHAPDDLNLCILRMFEDIFSPVVAHVIQTVDLAVHL